MSGALSHSPANVIRYLLIDLAQGTLPSDGGSWPVHHEREPDTPDSVITTYNTSGRIQGRTHHNGEIQEHFGIQVRVRDANPLDGWTKINAIAIALDESVSLTTVTISSNTYLIQAVTRTGGVLSLGKETPTSKRNLFTLNALVCLRQTV